MSKQRWDWIFDWSGTLVDDMALVVCATNHVMRQYGKPEWDREAFRRHFSLPYEAFYEEYVPGVALEEIEQHFREGFALSKEEVPVLEHARDFLDYLARRGDRMYVLTSMCAKAFEEQVVSLGLEHFFEARYAGVLDKRERIGEIIERHGMQEERTIFVGDMTHDVETAHHGGVHSVGVLTGYNHREVLEAVHPSVLANDLEDLRNMLESDQSWEQLVEKV
ncbi:HAD family hydrolase [Rubritalea tangerina]|uniref:phosphoglycolate phosphatase n=1 Tax=Rubritalea tangerina TaxID=430798 RepID=A0ABW4ZA14_9BACT